MNTQRKDRIEELEGQIRDELDRRIGIQVTEFRKRAGELFKDDEYEIFTAYLNALLENAEASPPDGSEAIVQSLKSDEKAQAIFSKLKDVLRLKDMAIEVSGIDGPNSSGKVKPRLSSSSSTIYLPSSLSPAARKEINTPDDLRSALNGSAKSLACIFPDPDNWVGWLICWLEALDKEALALEKDTDFEQVLERLMDMISNRLYNKRW